MADAEEIFGLSILAFQRAATAPRIPAISSISHFLKKELLTASDVAHVDVTGELPTTPRNWRH